MPAGSLLVFNGYVNPDRVIAVNPADGTVIASLVLAGNYDLSAGLYDAASGHLFITDNSGSVLREIDPATGAQIGANIAVPINVQTWSGLAIDPVSGNLWLGSSNGGAALVEITRSRHRGAAHQHRAVGHQPERDLGPGVCARRQPVGQPRTQGVIYRVDTTRDAVAVASATLSQVLASATDGVAANGALAAANVGQVIELRRQPTSAPAPRCCSTPATTRATPRCWRSSRWSSTPRAPGCRCWCPSWPPPARCGWSTAAAATWASASYTDSVYRQRHAELHRRQPAPR